MSGEPMEVAVALSLLLAESCPTTNPFYGQILTFESRPQLCQLKNIPDYERAYDPTLMSQAAIASKLGSLKSRVHDVKRYPWGGSTDVEAAFDKLLELLTTKQGLNNRKRKAGVTDDFVRNTKLVIFSDMEFDVAAGHYSYCGSRNMGADQWNTCLLYTSPSPRDRTRSRMPSSA